jgi:hypothetical protein
MSELHVSQALWQYQAIQIPIPYDPISDSWSGDLQPDFDHFFSPLQNGKNILVYSNSNRQKLSPQIA